MGIELDKNDLIHIGEMSEAIKRIDGRLKTIDEKLDKPSECSYKTDIKINTWASRLSITSIIGAAIWIIRKGFSVFLVSLALATASVSADELWTARDEFLYGEVGIHLPQTQRVTNFLALLNKSDVAKTFELTFGCDDITAEMPVLAVVLPVLLCGDCHSCKRFVQDNIEPLMLEWQIITNSKKIKVFSAKHRRYVWFYSRHGVLVYYKNLL